MTGDLGRFDGAAADLLPPRDVGAAERVRPQALEVATFRACGLVERVADRRIAHWPVRGPLLIKDPALGSGVFGRGFLAEPLDRIPDAKHAPAVLGLWAADMLVPDALFDLDRPGVQVHVLPLQAKDLGDARACGDAGFEDEFVELLHPGQHACSLVKEIGRASCRERV